MCLFSKVQDFFIRWIRVGFLLEGDEMFTRGQKTCILLAACVVLCHRLLAGKGRRNPPSFFIGKVKAIVSCCCSMYAIVTGLESVNLLLFVVLTVCGFCSDGFQEDCGAAGQGLELFYQLLCFNTCSWTGHLVPSSKLEHESPPNPGCSKGFYEKVMALFSWSALRYKK